MTRFDRIETRLPELLDELAAGRPKPEYLDALLWQTARTRQKPAWASLERWIPMLATAGTLPARMVRVRILGVVAIVIALAIGIAIVASGAFTPRLPNPFGPARNGAILYATQGGAIVVLDPASGATRTLLGGTTYRAPVLSRDGTTFVFGRVGDQGMAIWVARFDGSNARELIPARLDFVSALWSPNGDRIAFVEGPKVYLAEVATGALSTITLPETLGAVTWRPGSNDLIVTTAGIGQEVRRTIYTVDARAGAVARPLVVKAHVISEPDVSVDGSMITYTTWDEGQPGLEGRIHLLDLASGTDRLLTADLNDGYQWQDARFSPDGKWVLSERHSATSNYLTLVSVTDASAQVVLRPSYPTFTRGATETFTPDGTAVLARDRLNDSIWLLPTDGSAPTQLGWQGVDPEAVSWQRLAP